MKVGDIVRQNNNLLEMRKNGKPRQPPKIVGVVVDIRNQLPPKQQETEYLRSWMARLGRQVDVLWSNGRLSKNFAENSLEVVISND
jgi:hypothetical protein